MSEPTAMPVTCECCCFLHRKQSVKVAICGCRAKYRVTGEIYPRFPSDHTCEFALISAHCDPEFKISTSIREYYQKKANHASEVAERMLATAGKNTMPANS